MRAERSYDTAKIRRVLSEMGPVVAEDGESVEDCHIDPVGVCWLMVYDDSHDVALYRVSMLNSVTFEVHANVLPTHRARGRHASARSMYRWLLDNSQCQKLVTWVPCMHTHILRFAREMGMREEGRLRDSYPKDSKLWDQHLMAIGRAGMEAQCHQ